VSAPAARLATGATIAEVLLLASLHLLSPEFDPSWRMISEYALGHYGWVLSLMFLCSAVSAWALAIAIRAGAQTAGGKTGLWFLVIAGAGGAMASVFDITHDVGHEIAGVLGVIGFPIAAVLLSSALGRLEPWRTCRKTLAAVAHLSWISVVLLIATLVLMTVQMAHANGGHLPQHAPKVLPAGVFRLDGWANRLIVLSNCLWVFIASWHAVKRGPAAARPAARETGLPCSTPVSAR
jgi:hypothetical protein